MQRISQIYHAFIIVGKEADLFIEIDFVAVS